MAKETWEILDSDYLYFDNDKYKIEDTTSKFGYSHFEGVESWGFYILGKKVKTKGNMEVWAIFDASEQRYDTDYYNKDLAGETEIFYRSDLIYDIGSWDEISETWDKLNR